MRFSDGLESLGNWYNKVTDFDDDAFNTVSATIYEKQEEIVTTLSIVPPMRLQNLSTQRSRPSVRSSMDGRCGVLLIPIITYLRMIAHTVLPVSLYIRLFA